MNYDDLVKISGIDSAKATTLLAAFELAKRAMEVNDTNLPTIVTPKDVVAQLTDLRHNKKEHFIYPNLIKRLVIDQPDLVWATDITYIRLANNWAYLVAIMDWFSRYVIAWQLSSKLETNFCLTALENSLNKNRPQYFHSDQGSQFTSKEFIDKLKEEQIKISMSSKGRYHDNIFVERLWRTVKYEDIYLKHYTDIQEAEKGLKEYFHFYNFEREHSSLNDKTPAQIYSQNKSQLVNFSLKTSGNVSLNSNFAVQRIRST